MSQNLCDLELIQYLKELNRKIESLDENNVSDKDIADIKQKMQEWEDKGYLDPIDWTTDTKEMIDKKTEIFGEYVEMYYSKCTKN